MKMITRKFGILTSVSAEESIWRAVDAFVDNVIEKDVNEEVDYIGFSQKDIRDGILQENAMLFVSGKDFPSCELADSVACGLNTAPEWDRNDMLPRDFICLWHREGC